MRVVLVGTAADRRRLREQLANTPIVITGEAASVDDARALAGPADALVLAGRQDTDVIRAAREELTPREHDVLELLALGLSNKSIASRLGISDQTVKFHIASIIGKLGAANRTSAVRLAIDRGLVTL